MKMKSRRKGSPTRLVWLFMLPLLMLFPSCNVTRKITTEASYFQKGDTTTTIVTRTTETYDAKKNLNY